MFRNIVQAVLMMVVFSCLEKLIDGLIILFSGEKIQRGNIKINKIFFSSWSYLLAVLYPMKDLLP